eukprot:CAMPEP_0195157288 /NCGR_PEP_ID=MMETSP0448-20130528/185088_1 /TAXON_ID=66468 /ORGANISM="Heterocapsa triquestra, Strain CCMP 448" /LENGTH=456 /DNA_ID=CAMNT_0040196081 /DNA_START=32 /DNA_END=1399 /DNA_ORIENTATION=-
MAPQICTSTEASTETRLRVKNAPLRAVPASPVLLGAPLPQAKLSVKNTFITTDEQQPTSPAQRRFRTCPDTAPISPSMSSEEGEAEGAGPCIPGQVSKPAQLPLQRVRFHAEAPWVDSVGEASDDDFTGSRSQESSEADLINSPKAAGRAGFMTEDLRDSLLEQAKAYNIGPAQLPEQSCSPFCLSRHIDGLGNSPTYSAGPAAASSPQSIALADYLAVNPLPQSAGAPHVASPCNAGALLFLNVLMHAPSQPAAAAEAAAFPPNMLMHAPSQPAAAAAAEAAAFPAGPTCPPLVYGWHMPMQSPVAQWLPAPWPMMANDPLTPPSSLPHDASMLVVPQKGQRMHEQQESASAAEAAPDKEGRPRRSGHSRRLRLWAHIYLHMDVHGFDLVPRLIGRGGANMRRIADKTQAKIRIRGRGSGHLEVDGKYEAPTPLMVAVTTDRADASSFRHAVELM